MLSDDIIICSQDLGTQSSLAPDFIYRINRLAVAEKIKGGLAR